MAITETNVYWQPRTVRAVLLLAVVAWSTAGAQRTVDARAGAAHAEMRPIREASSIELVIDPPTHRPSAIPYVVTGAVVGAVAMAGGLWIYFHHSDTEFLAPIFALAPAVTAGGAVGATAGWLVHRLRHR